MAVKDSDLTYWDRIARNYDAHTSKSNSMYTNLIQFIRQELEPDFTVLDIGTGTGEIPLAIYNSVRQIEAIDYSEEMITCAAAKAAQRSISSVRFTMQDSRQLFYKDEQFDVVLMANVLHIVPRPDQILAEVYRVLKPTGKLIAPTYIHGESMKSRLISRFLQWKGHPIHSRYDSVSLRQCLKKNRFDVIRQQLVTNIMPCSFVVASKNEN
jgi:ubiquinone/menaquinone biosynthesis C-methylase UbiE